MYLKVAKSVNLKSSHHIHKKITMWGDACITKLIVVIISKYICVSNHHVVHLKYKQCYMSMDLNKAKK